MFGGDETYTRMNLISNKITMKEKCFVFIFHCDDGSGFGFPYLFSTSCCVLAFHVAGGNLGGFLGRRLG